MPRGWAAERQVVHGHIPRVVAELHLQTVGRFPGTNRLRLAIGLPLRNREGLDRLLQQIYDPASTNYHHYLTPQQFTEMFGPTEQDYQAVMAFAMANGLTVTATHPNRVVLDVAGAVTDIERTFHVQCGFTSIRRKRARFTRRMSSHRLTSRCRCCTSAAWTTTHSRIRSCNQAGPAGAGQRYAQTPVPGPSGTYRGSDFRAAYVPGTSLTGAGQSVGLLQFDGFYTNDIATYEARPGLRPAFR